MDNDLRSFIAKIEGWIDAEASGLDYDRATSFCDNCPYSFGADDEEYVASSCCKEDDDYQVQEIEAINKARNAVKALREFLKEFEVDNG